MKERISSVGSPRYWSGSIPLHYEYTAGVAGEKFLRGLIAGRILSSVCTRCNIAYLPPKIYCTNCFGEIDKYKSVGRKGILLSVTETHVDFDGSRLREPRLIGFVGFEKVRGGLIRPVKGRRARIGAQVSARFLPRSRRVGALTDIEFFVAT